MAKTNQNDTIYANNVRTWEFTVINADATPNIPVNLTGYTVQWALSRFAPDGTYSTNAVLEKDNQSKGGVVITDAVNGVVQVNILDSDTAALFGKFYQELEIVDTVGNAVVVATGTITILKNVSNT